MARFAVLSLLVASLCVAYAEYIDPTTQTQLKPFRGQFAITLWKIPGGVGDPLPQICNDTAISAPCHQPVLSHQHKDAIVVKVALVNATSGKTTLTTLGDLTYNNSMIKLCYSQPYAVDRAWRKANPILAKDKSCPIIVQKFKLNATNAANILTATYMIPDNITSATWYARVVSKCNNGSELQFCQLDGTVNVTYVGTETVENTTPAMVALTIVFALLGPVIFFGYSIYKVFLVKKVAK